MSDDPYALPSGKFAICGTWTRGWNGESVEEVSGEMTWSTLTAGRKDGRCVLSVRANLSNGGFFGTGIGLDRAQVERLSNGDRAIQEIVVKELSEGNEDYELSLQ